MKIDREKLYKEYMDWVYKISEDMDWKTHFTPREIVNAIIDILENNPKFIKNESKIK